MRLKLASFFITIFGLIFFITACQHPAKKNTLSLEKQVEYINKGKKITMFSYKAFSRELLKAIEAGGVENAVGYCHLKANPLTDSLSRTFGADIKRISDKFRDPINKPDPLDEQVIQSYQQQLSEGQELQPHLEFIDSTIIFYSPILILNPVCLQCHGLPGSSMDTKTDDFIKAKYPDDKAIGYKLGDLRGVFRVTFKSKI
jgi:hypothetical protein